MTITQEAIISELIESTRKTINQGEQFKQKPLKELNWKLNENTWSVLECIEHLNLYSDFYLSEIEKSMNKNNASTEKYFKSGLLGNYFAKSMLPKDKLNKMNTFKSKNPNGSVLDKLTLNRFLTHQEKTLNLLDQARKVNLNKIKTPTTLGKLVKLNLGDTFRVVIYHNHRHMIQAQKSLKTAANI